MFFLNDFKSNKQKAWWYYVIGHDYIESSGILFNERLRMNSKDPSFSLLLVTGLELVFKSFLLMYGSNITEHDLRNKVGHNYIEAYKKCREVDLKKEIFCDSKLELEISSLSEKFPNSLECRYIQGIFHMEFNPKIFKILEEKLLSILEKKYNGDFGLSLSSDNNEFFKNKI